MEKIVSDNISQEKLNDLSFILTYLENNELKHYEEQDDEGKENHIINYIRRVKKYFTYNKN